jgi:hypothetical protein
LREAIHAFVDADVDETVVDLGHQVVFFDDFGGNEIDGNTHVFGILHGGVEVEILDVGEAHAGVFIGDDGVGQALESGEIGGGSTGAAGIIDEVATNGEAGTFLLSFLGAFRANKATIGRGLAFRDFVLVDEEDGIGAFDAATDTLG